jgi:FixJ family two-component response regulator
VQVFDVVVTGHTSASISNILKISPRTVESYRVPDEQRQAEKSSIGDDDGK